VSKPELEFHLPSEPWIDAGDGIAEQTLAADPESGARSALVRWAPGTDTSPAGASRHAYWEEVFLLEGELTDLTLGMTFPAGHYACRPPGMPHGPWITRPGVLMLVFTYPDAAPGSISPPA
jgi:hypothetical protein